MKMIIILILLLCTSSVWSKNDFCSNVQLLIKKEVRSQVSNGKKYRRTRYARPARNGRLSETEEVYFDQYDTIDFEMDDQTLFDESEESKEQLLTEIDRMVSEYCN